ncbi:hypothetical protein [Alishewanella tabrizica]|uniref:hypothetical protein n=1 Tax=Alishewanella tabrizica TaxID=671278 RepID=UPI0016775EB0|nr:hypothetical protein [Alishewanella tabrizica]
MHTFINLPISNFSQTVAASIVLSRTIDHKNLVLRPKSDQQFSHSLSEKPTLAEKFTNTRLA